MTTAVQNGHGPSQPPTVDPSENPLHRLTPEQIEAIGKEFDELHEQVKADLGERDATYIRSMIAFQRRLALFGRAELIASRWRAPWLLGAATLGLSKILENMEIGHNVMHGQWDWMNDPVINSKVWDWDTASTAEAWRHSHNFIHHTYTNIRGKDRDLGYEIMRIDPAQKWYPFYLLQPIYNLILAAPVRVGRRHARSRLRRDPLGREEPEAGPQGAQGDRRQGPHADRQGLHRLAGDQRRGDGRASRPAVLAAKAARREPRPGPDAQGAAAGAQGAAASHRPDPTRCSAS